VAFCNYVWEGRGGQSPLSWPKSPKNLGLGQKVRLLNLGVNAWLDG